MLIPKKNRLAIYSYLFNEGVLCCRKDLVLTKHAQIECPNLHVAKLMQSLHSRNYVREKHSWGWNYYFLTDEGIEYLRNYLHVSADVVPATMKKQTKAQAPPSFGSMSRQNREDRPRRDGYRGGKKDGDAPRGFNPEFAGRGGRGGMRGRRGGHAGDRA